MFWVLLLVTLREDDGGAGGLNLAVDLHQEVAGAHVQVLAHPADRGLDEESREAKVREVLRSGRAVTVVGAVEERLDLVLRGSIRGKRLNAVRNGDGLRAADDVGVSHGVAPMSVEGGCSALMY
jgi:hypothetical protein